MRRREALIALTLGISLLSCRETVSTNYASSSEARRAGALEKGWLPNVLPPSAVDIWERHDIDTNETWGAFRFATSDAAGLLSAVAPVDASTQTVRDPGDAPDWPDALRGRLGRDRLDPVGLEVFKSTAQELYLAVDWKRGIAYFWRPAS